MYSLPGCQVHPSEKGAGTEEAIMNNREITDEDTLGMVVQKGHSQFHLSRFDETSDRFVL
jgi:hypothetical protein